MAEVRNADLSAGLNTGDIVECIVEQIMPYGAFVRITKTGRKGMIHISELSYSFVKNINDVLNIGDKIQAKIIRIDEKGRIDLSLKQASEPPQVQAQTQSRPQRHNTTPAEHDGARDMRGRPPRTEGRENFRQKREFRETRDFHEMREAYHETEPDDDDSFEKKIASFLKNSEAKITDLNSRNSARSGRSTRRRQNNGSNNNREY